MWTKTGSFQKLCGGTKIPSKVSFLVWRIFYDRLATKLNLRNRSIRGVRFDTSYIFCNNEEETLQHLFFSCSFS